MVADLEMVMNEKTQDNFRIYLNTRLSAPDGVEEVMVSIVEYLTTFFRNFTQEEITNMCLDKSDKGAKENGPEVLSDPEILKREKLLEVLDLINYTAIEEFQKQ